MRALDFLTEASSTLTLYHGSGKDFSEFDEMMARVKNDYYGGGISYFTDSKEIGESYARTTARRSPGDIPILYTVELTVNKLFNVDAEYTGEDLAPFLDRKVRDDFLRGAKLLPLGANKYKIVSDLESGKTSLTGDQIFRGLSNGMNNTLKAREFLKSLGYDTLRYNGGLQTRGPHHNVYITYKKENIKIVDKTELS